MNYALWINPRAVNTPGDTLKIRFRNHRDWAGKDSSPRKGTTPARGGRRRRSSCISPGGSG